MDELKSCPFCGGEAELKQHKSAIDKDNRPIGGWFVDCDNCGCGTPWHNTEVKAITTWNRRPTPENKPLTLDQLRQMDGEPVLDMRKPNKAHTIEIPEQGLRLEPGKLYLGRTAEYTKTDGYVPMLEGRSSVGRLGMCIHATAGFGDVGFAGFWTLEIFVVQPLIVYPWVEICQIYYHALEGNYTPYRSGKYQHNTGIQASMMYKDFERGAK